MKAGLSAPNSHSTPPDVGNEPIKRIAELLRERNALDAEIAAIVHRPMTSGHPGEWIASQVFDIELKPSAVAAASDGRFRSGPLQGRGRRRLPTAGTLARCKGPSGSAPITGVSSLEGKRR